MFKRQTPDFLKNFRDVYRQSPREATLRWFNSARYGLFVHYGLYSLLGRHEWVQFREKIPVAEYAKLKDSFYADNFDAFRIASFAGDCGMNYINITTRHHDSFCLWDTKETGFNSVNSPADRDLIKEMEEACGKYGLGLFLYYSHGRDWKHPHAPNNDEWGGKARPAYEPPEPSYKYGEKHDLNIYLDFVKKQVTELLLNYPSIAGIWLDGSAVTLSGDASKFKCQELYDHIHKTHPHALVSYKQGITGTEDFFAPEHKVPAYSGDKKTTGKIGDRNKSIEICTTMIEEPMSWGYMKGARHKNAAQVWEQLKIACESGANLLLNTGPGGDGGLDPADEKALREAGEKLRTDGFPCD